MRETRKLTENDYEQSLELSQYAFQYTVAEADKPKRKESLKRHEVWGEFEQGALTSKVHVLSFTIFLGETEMKMGGVAGVATWPEYRRNGSVSRLLSISLQSMKDKGQVISFLHPFDIDFYRRFGWELCFSQKKYEIEKANLHLMEATPGTIKRVTVKEDLDTLNRMYEGYAKNYNGMLKRDSYWWENHVYSTGFQFAVYFNEKNEANGYVFYKISDNIMDVQEFIYANGEARRGLWNFICQHDSMVDKVKMLVSEDEGFNYLLKNPKVKIENVPYFMARIVDVEGFLNQYHFLKTDERLVLHIRDDRAVWNNRSFQIEDGAVTEVSLEYRGITVDIHSLTALLIGSQTAMFLYEAGKLLGTPNDILVLERMIQKRPTSILDFF